MENANKAISRRNFLKLAAATSAGVTASLAVPTIAGRGPVPSLFGGGDFKIGVLLPTSGTYPLMGENLAEGMRAYFNSASLSTPGIAVETIPGGYSRVASKVTKLVEEDRVDIVVAGASSAVAPTLRDVLEPRQVPFIISNTGVSPVEKTALGKYGIHNSLGLWQASWAAGMWTGTNVGRKALVVTTLADSGNSSIHSFQSGLGSVGGQVVDTIVVDDTIDDGWQTLRGQIESARPDFVYLMISGAAQAKFLDAYDQLKMPPLFLGGLMAESLALAGDSRATGLTDVSSWSDTLASEANLRFSSAYRNQTGRNPDPFAALGYETALMIDRSVDSSTNRLSNPDIGEILQNEPLVGPRGTVSLDLETRSTTVPLYVRKVQSTGLTSRTRVMGSLRAITLGEAIEAGVMAGTTSGLLNEYLCCEPQKPSGLFQRLFSSSAPAGW